MTNDEIQNSYRNILVMLARHYVNIITLSKAIRIQAGIEETPGRKSGLYCHAKVMMKYAHELREVLMENRKEMLEFFGTSNLQLISKQQLRLP